MAEEDDYGGLAGGQVELRCAWGFGLDSRDLCDFLGWRVWGEPGGEFLLE